MRKMLCVGVIGIYTVFAHAIDVNTVNAIQAKAINTATTQSIHQNTSTNETEPAYLQWGLDKEDWTEFQKITQDVRQYWTPHLDPLTTLGVSTDDPVKRMKYARLLAKKEHDRVERELAFQRAYDKAFKELYPREQMFDMSKIHSTSNTPEKVGRIRYFVRLIDCATCSEDFKRLQQAYPTSPIDIYFVGKATNEGIREWAKAENIKVADVNSGTITLNYDRGAWFTHSKGKMPIAFSSNWLPLTY
ncbi:hypothetical protein A6A19_07755 [Actinobacillus delphinicola]|uniref:TIGR03759 family integrating conjugative element protein n=1 Tax=Actinobacillus delphinicola TaxID=51161 RepID=UPI002440ED24|nr:TIGR03759 family integrating conjugative element protein [Actinobacillus delphinicola]MDG6897869.1 hypothetical protein [Actinobacillus delphinicola]